MPYCPKCDREFPESVQICPDDSVPLQSKIFSDTGMQLDSRVGMTLDAKYRLDELLSVGATSSIYRATHLLINRPVAVKILNANDEAVNARFRREVRLLARAHHPNVVNVMDFGESSDGLVYYVMECLEGRTLRDLLKSEGPLDAVIAVSLMLQISIGVSVIHNEGIIHRNIKPPNIFVVRHPGQPPLVKLLGFGIARLAGDDDPQTLSQVGTIIGTPKYMSPEQCAGAMLTTASDVYSLGIVFYEMLTGNPPFNGSTPLAIVMHHSNSQPQPPREVVSAIPQPIETLVLEALEKDPKLRPGDGAAFRAKLLETAQQLGWDNADAAEDRARDSLAKLDYSDAIRNLETAIVLDPERTERLNVEFGFLLGRPNMASGVAFSEEHRKNVLEWRARVWRLLCAHVEFEPPLLKDVPPVAKPTVVSQERVDGKYRLRNQANVSAERRGEILEESVLRLLREFFRLGEGADDLLRSLRKQRRGTQFGFDIGFECVLENNMAVRCHVECKNLSKEITLKDIAHKLISQNHYDKNIQFWILISPRANPSNELDQILEGWRTDPQYPFDIQVWCPATGLEELFGLEPAVYDEFYQPTNQESHPRTWAESKRSYIAEKWRRKLVPPLRLPRGWDKYLRQPRFLCVSRENHQALDATFSNHVSRLCKNESGALMSQPLEHYVREWLAQTDKPIFYLLGEFGDGKTFFTYILARKLAEEFLQNPMMNWIPVRISLRDLATAGSGRMFLRQRLEEFGADIEGWTTLRMQRRLLVILDGFDEMSKQLDPDTIAKNISTLATCYEEFEGCKVMITSRTHFFERWQDNRRLVTRLGPSVRFHLAPIPRQTTLSHLEETATQMGIHQSLDKLRKLHDPIGLAAKPLFLQMLKDTMHDLPDELDEITLYERDVQNTLSWKADLLEDTHLNISHDEVIGNLMSLLEEIAVELQLSTQEFVSLSRFAEARHRSFAEFLWQMAGSDRDHEDAKARVGVRSLLTRVQVPDLENEWTVDFCHRSIREYFVAKGLCSAIQRGVEEGGAFLTRVPVNHEILDFAAAIMRKMDISRCRDALLRLIRRTRAGQSPGRLGGNALTLLYRICPNLPDADYTNKDFDFADLEGADLSGRMFQRSSFRFADFANVNFEGANFENCDFTGVRIEETTAVIALAAYPSNDRILASYADGTARTWNLTHPRKSESHLVTTHFPRKEVTLGILRNGNTWMYDSSTLAFLDLSEKTIRQVASFPVNPRYRLESLTDTDLLVTRHAEQGIVELLLLDLKRQGAIEAVEASSVISFQPLGREAIVLTDITNSLSVVKLNSIKRLVSRIPAGEVITSLASRCVPSGLHLIAWGQVDGIMQAWLIDLRKTPFEVRKVFSDQIHEGPVTAVTFLDEYRIASGGQDRSIAITRVDTTGNSRPGIQERRLQLTLRCKGMKVKGLKGAEEQQKLKELIAKSELEVNL